MDQFHPANQQAILHWLGPFLPKTFPIDHAHDVVPVRALEVLRHVVPYLNQGTLSMDPLSDLDPDPFLHQEPPQPFQHEALRSAQLPSLPSRILPIAPSLRQEQQVLDALTKTKQAPEMMKKSAVWFCGPSQPAPNWSEPPPLQQSLWFSELELHLHSHRGPLQVHKGSRLGAALNHPSGPSSSKPISLLRLW